MRRWPLARTALGLSLSIVMLLFGAASATTRNSAIPWTELAENDPLLSLSVRRAIVDGRTVHYPPPTRELADALERRAAGAGDPIAVIALRHLAEAKRELADLAGAERTLEAWAQVSGESAGAAWAEAARWGARYREWSFAFRCADRALKSTLGASEKRALATERIAWAEAHPEAADALALRAERAGLFPDEAAFTEDWISALEKAGRLAEAEAALRKATALPEERRTCVVSDLLADHGNKQGAYDVLEAFIGDPDRTPSAATLKTFATRADEVARARVDGWRATLETRFDPRAFLLFERYLEGKSRGDLASELMRQVERRHEKSFDRRAWELDSQLWRSINAVPEAFRARLAAAASKETTREQKLEDLAHLSNLAFKAGARPLPWGTYADESYRWAARLDVTPGFVTGGLSLLLTGFEREAALSELQARRLPDRTFETARLLVAELAKRDPSHRRLPALYVALMAGHVSRNEGAEALKLLPKTEAGDVTVRADARRAALQAMRQTKTPIDAEARLWKERLALVAPDGSIPEMEGRGGVPTPQYGETENGESGEGESVEEGGDAMGSETPDEARVPIRSLAASPKGETYGEVLREAVTRLNARDKKHGAALTLLLGEIDRLPKAEKVWLFALDQIEGYKLGEGLEARYRKALETFDEPGWWNRLARFYARSKRNAELKEHADQIVARFRSSDIFKRDPNVSLLVPAENQPNPFIRFGSYLRLEALKRFPQSPDVLREAESRLLSRSAFERLRPRDREDRKEHGVIDDALLEARRNALLFVDAGRRSAFLDELVRAGRLESFLFGLEKTAARTPVEDRFLLDGWCRLSRFERAAPFVDRLADAYPGEREIADAGIGLHRSLSGLDPKHAEAVTRIANAVAPTLEDPGPIYTALGETWQDLDRPGPAGEAWRKNLRSAPRDPARILELATVFWDYGRMKEALDVLEEGRKRLDRPRLDAFEAGVLREEVRDLPGALEEYVRALRGENDWRTGAWWGGEYRAQQRLAKLLGRKRVQALLAARIDALAPGDKADEEALVALLPTLQLSPEEPCSCDDWMDLPHDPVGREQRGAVRAEARPSQREGIARIGERVLAKTRDMIPKATRVEFLNALKSHRSSLVDRRWAPEAGAAVDLDVAVLAREAALAPTEERRLEKEIARVESLRTWGRVEEAKTLWTKLRPRIQALFEGAAKIRDLVAGARFAETAGEDAEAAWKQLGASYPWSLGVLEDRLEFLFRAGKTAEALDLLENAASTAAPGHKENLTERLAKDALDRGDLPRGKRAMKTLLGFAIDDRRRLLVAGLLTRISYREDDKTFDPIALGKSESEKLPEELRPELWATLAAAARDEGRVNAALDLFIESLNRRMDTFRLSEACRLASRSGRSAHLLKFFETQKQRSPRDVRWAVAVRDIKTFTGDLEGAIAAAKDATLVAPERESLSRDVVTLLVRAGRPREAADFLETWNRPRRSDESVATWRASLYVKAGDVPRAIAIEREAIAAYVKEASGSDSAAVKTESGERTARAARRFLALGRPEAAWNLALPDGKLSRASEIPLSHAERAEIALRSENLVKLLRAFEKNEDFRRETPATIARFAKPEQLDELQGELLARLFPPGGPRNESALDRWWDFASEAGLARFPEAVSRRLVSSADRANAPWGEDPPVAFLSRLSPVTRAAAANSAPTRYAFAEMNFTAAWATYLAERDRLLLLEPILAPLVANLDGVVSAGTSIEDPLPWTSWFPVEAFARITAQPDHAGWRASVSAWFQTSSAWARFRAATGDRWNVALLVPLLPDETRQAWLAHTALRNGTPLDPVEAKRRAAVARVSSSLASLIENRSGAVAADDIVRLRGPRNVGDLLGADPRFTWSDFAPRPAETETRDDTVFGSGADRGRTPGRLWGARPGEAWYVLEALARWREKSADAPYVPLESPSRGDETTKTLLAVRTAEGLSDLPLALELDQRYFADLAKKERLARRLRLLARNGKTAEANELFRKEIVSRQGTADTSTFLGWRAVATDFGFTAPVDVLDREKPVSAALLAFLTDESPELADRFHPRHVADFRAALASLWWSVKETLTPEKTNRYLDELWVNGAANYPDVAVRKLGPWWVASRDFLNGIDARLRAEALAAVRALPDPKPLATFAAGHRDRREATELLLARAELASGDEASALARLDAMLASTAGTVETLKWAPATPPPTAEPGTTEEGEGGEIGPADVSRLTQWLRVFRESKRAEATAKAEEKLSRRLKSDLDAGRVGPSTWALAIDLATSKELLSGVVADLERSWVRGDFTSDGDVLAITRLLVPRDDAAARTWYARLVESGSFAAAGDRARVLSRLKDFDGAQGIFVDARRYLGLSQAEELQAFDEWRRIAIVSRAIDRAPASWKSALEFWRKKGPDLETWGDGLVRHLTRHPYDRLAARVVFRSLTPAREAVVAPAAAASGIDENVPSLRIARSELSRSARSANFFLKRASLDAKDLARRKFPRAEIDGLLADAARIGARSGDEALLDRALTQLEERKSPHAKALRAELGRERRDAAPRPETVRAVAGHFEAVRPRDLTWDLYARVLNAEDVP